MTNNAVSRSGLSKPELVKYPSIPSLPEAPDIVGLFCYIIKHYGGDGLVVAVNRMVGPKHISKQGAESDIGLCIVYGDWAGNRIDIVDGSQRALSARYFHEHYLKKFVEVMKLIGAPALQFYLTVGKDDLMLTDILTGGKFTGPGLVRDVFGRVITTQEVIKIDVIGGTVLDLIERGTGSFSGDLIMKPSRARVSERTGGPLYAQVKR